MKVLYQVIIGVSVAALIIGVLYFMPYSPLKSSPSVEIAGGYGKFEDDGLYHIYANVYNHGGEGRVTIEASVTQGGDKWIRRQTVHIYSGETEDLEFTFGEPEKTLVVWDPAPEISINVQVYWYYW